MRNSLLAILFLCGTIPLFAADNELATRFGVVRVVTDETDPAVHRLEVGSKTFLKFEGESIELQQLLTADDKDFVVVRERFGTSACPYNFVILELSERKTRISPEFGTCSDAETLELTGGSVVVAMPFYAEHRESRDARDLKAADRKLLVYKWKSGRLLASEKLR
jgi:hypothetical protein